MFNSWISDKQWRLYLHKNTVFTVNTATSKSISYLSETLKKSVLQPIYDKRCITDQMSCSVSSDLIHYFFTSVCLSVYLGQIHMYFRTYLEDHNEVFRKEDPLQYRTDQQTENNRLGLIDDNKCSRNNTYSITTLFVKHKWCFQRRRTLFILINRTDRSEQTVKTLSRRHRT